MMKPKLLIIGSIWLLPLACWYGAKGGDRAFALGVGGVISWLLTLLVARQPMLHCGACGAVTSYFDNYTSAVARRLGNWRNSVFHGTFLLVPLAIAAPLRAPMHIG